MAAEVRKRYKEAERKAAAMKAKQKAIRLYQHECLLCHILNCPIGSPDFPHFGHIGFRIKYHQYLSFCHSKNHHLIDDRARPSENYKEWNDFRDGKFVWADMIKRGALVYSKGELVRENLTVP